jgi:PAS domain S-box-containing protein
VTDAFNVIQVLLPVCSEVTPARFLEEGTVKNRTIQPWIILSLLLLFFLALPSEASADTTVRVGIFPFDPINYIDKDGMAKGLNPDLLREIFRNELTHLAFVPGSWQEGLKRLEDEEIDLMMSVAYSTKRAEVMDYGQESVLQLWGQVFAPPDHHSDNISDLFDKKIGVMARDISGLNFIATIERLGGTCEIAEFADFNAVFSAVQNGEVFAGVAPQHFGLRHAAEYNLIGTSVLFSPFSIYFTSKKGLHPELLSHIDNHLSRWKRDKDSIYYELLAKWMSPAGRITGIPAWLLPAFGAILVMVLVAGCFILLLNRAVKSKTRQLIASESRFRDVLLNISDFIWEIDGDGIFTYSSEHSLELLGYHPEEMIGRSHLDFVAQEYAEKAEKVFEKQKAFPQPYRNRVLAYVHKNGTEIFLQNSAVPVIDRSGYCSGFRGISTDITAIKQAEVERQSLEKKLAQAQKMEAVGTLAGGVAHDFNNILTSILGYTELAMLDTPAGSPVPEYLEQILTASNRARDLVKQILAFSRQGETECIHLQPAYILKEAIKMLRPTLPTTIEIKKDISQTDDTVFADPTQLNQVFMNLSTNAFHAMEESGGILEIRMMKVVLSAEDLVKDPDTQPGPFIKISVADSGTGIPPEIRDRIFDPYFTTKEMGKGTGMGLAIAHGIVKSYGGLISCYSQPGEGTVFHVFLPVSQEVQQRPAVDSVGDLHHGSERILLVDDEKLIVEVGKTVLESLGYTVLAVTDSGQALAIFREAPQAFDLIITDQTMPGMTGGELAEKMLQIRPELPIILTTGYSTIMTRERALELGIREFVYKPLSQKEIAGLIRSIFDSQQPVISEK